MVNGDLHSSTEQNYRYFGDSSHTAIADNSNGLVVSGCGVTIGELQQSADQILCGKTADNL